MNLFRRFRDDVIGIIGDLQREGRLPPGLDCRHVAVEPPRQAGRGDVTANAAMVLAKAAGMKPRDLAALLAERLGAVAGVTGVEVAGPGFINLSLDPRVWTGCLADVLAAGTAYGDSDIGQGEPVNIEYVSANPTGPLHVGHGRGAVVGDALAGLLAKAGYAVTREYYINDAGAQVEKLAYAAYGRYLEALGEAVPRAVVELFLADNPLEYRGNYLVPVGEALAREHGTGLVEKAPSEWLPEVEPAVVAAMLDLIEEDLAALGVRFDVFTSERALVKAGAVDDALATLAERDLVYVGVLESPKGKQAPEDWEPRPQTLFRASRFGDDVDRPLKKSDGSWTYFATDIAYHLDKYRRGFFTMIDVWGADHGGYVKRMKAAVDAVSDGAAELDVKLCQLVKLLEAGEPVKMSKRAGAFVTLREVIDRVGKDVVRFIMLSRSNDAPLDFDLARVTEQSRENPVFYVQYAHARARSVMRHAAEMFDPEDLAPAVLAKAPLERLVDPAEFELIKVMADWPRVVEGAAAAHEPHRIAYYLGDVAAAFHALWNKGKDEARLRFLVADDRPLTLARLALVQALAFIVASGLETFGVTPVEEMR